MSTVIQSLLNSTKKETKNVLVMGPKTPLFNSLGRTYFVPADIPFDRINSSLTFIPSIVICTDVKHNTKADELTRKFHIHHLNLFVSAPKIKQTTLYLLSKQIRGINLVTSEELSEQWMLTDYQIVSADNIIPEIKSYLTKAKVY